MIVLATLLLWQNRRHSVTIRAWFPIVALAAIGWYVKEDTVMVLPALLACQALRARWSRDVPAPSRRLVLASAILLAGLVALRFAILPQFLALPGRSVSFDQGVMSLAYGLGRPFFARRVDASPRASGSRHAAAPPDSLRPWRSCRPASGPSIAPRSAQKLISCTVFPRAALR